jgi:hypothetical protein
VVQVADASVAIRGDMTGFNADLNRVEATTKGFAGRVSDNIKKSFSARNLLGAFGLTYGATQLVQFAGDAAQSFGELEQTVNTIDEVFGESAATIHEWGETAAETAGMSQQTFMSSAAIMGQTLQNMGFEIQESANLTVQLLERAADMALAFGKRPQDALLAITAAMRGERDTIEKFGVAIKQVDVNAKISALGLDTSTAAAKKYAEAAAVVELVLEQSADQAGRFAQSQDDVAARMAVANARWDDFIAKDVGGAIASIQLGAFEVADRVSRDVQNMSEVFDWFALNLGSQRATIMQEADRIGTSFETLRDRVNAFMQQGYSFEIAVDLAVNNDAAQAVVEQISSEFRQSFNDRVDDFRASSIGAGDAVSQGIADGMAANEEELAKASEDSITGTILSTVRDRFPAITGAGSETMTAYAKGLLDAQQRPVDQMEILMDMQETVLDEGAEVARLKGQLTSAELAAGLLDNRPAVRAQAEAARLDILAQLGFLEDDAFGWGYNITRGMAAGVRVGKGNLVVAARELGGALRNQIGIESEPKDHTSPLYGHMKWGSNLVLDFANSIYGSLGTASSAAAAMAGALVPSLSGGAMGMGVSAMPMGGGNTYVLHVNGVQYEVAGFDEMAEKLMELGVLNGDGRLA